MIENRKNALNRYLFSLVLALAAAWSCPAHAGGGKAPARFLDGTKNPALLAAIRKAVSPRITFDGHFSDAYVSCGPGCDSYWFVDRKTGGVIEVPPPGAAKTDMIWDVRSRPDSDTITVTYGPGDGVVGKCVAVRFRLTGSRFVSLEKPLPVHCPS